jgi:hypothetical protein
VLTLGSLCSKTQETLSVQVAPALAVRQSVSVAKSISLLGSKSSSHSHRPAVSVKTGVLPGAAGAQSETVRLLPVMDFVHSLLAL